MKRRSPAPAARAAEISPWISAAVGLVAFVAYLAMAPSVSGDKDAGEFTLVLATNGIAHPTGYPLFTLIGHLFVLALHSLGASWPYAANAWSALGGGVAIAFLHALASRLPSRAARPERRWIPLLPVALFALNPAWTNETTLAEVNSWHVAWALGLGCLFVSTLGRVRETGRPSHDLRRRALVWGALCGIGLAHHLTSVLVAGPLTAVLLFSSARARRLDATAVLLGMLALLVPLSAYLWIAWRAFHPGAFTYPTLMPSAAGILWHITGSGYAQFLGHFEPSPFQRELLSRYIYPFLFPGLALLALAAARAKSSEDRIALWSLLGAAILGTAYAFVYGVADPSSYFLAPMALATLSPAILLSGWAARARVPAVAIAGLAIWLSFGWTRTGIERKRQFGGFEGLLHAMWASIPSDSGFVLWRDDMYVRLMQYQIFQGEKPGLWVGNPLMLRHPAVRERFVRRFDFDPVAGVDLRVPAPGNPDRERILTRTMDEIEESINRQSPMPVIHFDPSIPTVRLLKKAERSAGVSSQ
jgi:hypothetical protein